MQIELDHIYNMDCIEAMQQMPDGCVHCCVTSPPYLWKRDYDVDPQLWPEITYRPIGFLPPLTVPSEISCLGLESTPQAYIAHCIYIFREVWRVLRNDGTFWLNIGDTYSTSGNQGHRRGETFGGFNGKLPNSRYTPPKGYKRKELLGIPMQLILALQAEGWYFRRDNIWCKPNVMPESCTDRCTTAHEYVFHLTKSPKYYYDGDAIREKYVTTEDHPGGRNKRSVWTIPTKPFPDAHFATFPPDLIEPCILAGCPEGGVVLDPFMGSGTTALVAYRLRRHFLGAEIKPEYNAMAMKRLEDEMAQMRIPL